METEEARADRPRRRAGPRRDRRGGGPPWATGEPWRGRAGRRPTHGRVFLVAIVATITVVGAHLAGRHQGDSRPLDHLGYALLVAGVLAMLFRVRWRVPAYVVSLGTTVAYVLFGYPYGPVFFAVLISLFGAVRTGHRVPVWITTVTGYLVFTLFALVVPSIGGVTLRRPSLGSAIEVAAWMIVALAVAEANRVRAERFAEIARTHTERARARAEQERRQASEERLRIARELHDVLGHHLSLINVRAGVGLHLMDEQPEQARIALAAIKQASAAALAEVRAVLGVLRPEGEEPPRAPAPSLANVATLIGPAETAVIGTPVPLPPEVDRAAFRIVQESLTNVRRHAGEGATASLIITYRPDLLVVRVSDDGTGPSGGPAGPGSGPPAEVGNGTPAEVRNGTPAEAGNGIAGMRARADALGGTLVAGAGSDRGYVVTATLPLRPPGPPASREYPSPDDDPSPDRDPPSGHDRRIEDDLALAETPPSKEMT